MLDKWILDGWTEAPMIVLSGAATYAAILLYTRIVGLRSLSKMSASDFAMTVAVGSLFASVASGASPALVPGLVALATLYAGQWFLAWARLRSETVSRIVDNTPLLLMSGREILDDNLKRANVTRSDLFAKLREANALDYDDVLAVVFETTGDVSVLHSNDPDAKLEPDFLINVNGSDQLPSERLRAEPAT